MLLLSVAFNQGRCLMYLIESIKDGKKLSSPWTSFLPALVRIYIWLHKPLWWSQQWRKDMWNKRSPGSDDDSNKLSKKPRRCRRNSRWLPNSAKWRWHKITRWQWPEFKKSSRLVLRVLTIAVYTKRKRTDIATGMARGGGSTCGKYWWGCAARFFQIVTLFQTKKYHFSHPFSDLAFKKLFHKNNYLD